MPPKRTHDIHRTNSSRHSVGQSESAGHGGSESNRPSKLDISFLVNQSRPGSSSSGGGDSSVGRQQSLSSKKSGTNLGSSKTGAPKRHQCEVCSRTFAQNHDKSKHHRTVHEKLRPYTCDICQNKFGEKGNLSKHRKSVHLKERPFSCDKCSSVFAFKDGLKRHRSLVHYDERPFRCSECPASFKQISQLRKHTSDKHPSGAAGRGT